MSDATINANNQTPAGSAFAYDARTSNGERITGTIDAGSAEAAGGLLRSLGLEVLNLAPAFATGSKRLRPLRTDEFVAFNQQLAQLTEAGLPVEHGLRLIAKDVRSGRLAQTINAVAGELEGGASLPQAFEKHRRQFPSLYSRLIDAGVRANNLPAMLLNLGRHAQLVQRMRAMLWEALSYPVIVILCLLGLLAFLGILVLPRFEAIFKDFGTQLPGITVMAMEGARLMPVFLVALLVLLVAAMITIGVLKSTGASARAYDLLVLPMPLIGPVMTKNLVARWCDAMATALGAGLDLPAAIDVAGEAVGSPAVARDGRRLVEKIEAGQSPEGAETRILPPAVGAMLSMGAQGKDLPTALVTLGQMYQEQSELRLATLPAVLTPLLFLLIGAVIAFVVVALFAPIISLIQSVSGPMKK